MEHASRDRASQAKAHGGDDGKRRPVIRVRDLEQRFGDHLVFEGLDLDVFPREVMGIVGGSGSGKSILLTSIIGLHTPTSGRVEVFGQDMTETPLRELHGIQRRWGVLFQSDALFSNLTVLENIVRVMKEHHNLPDRLASEVAALKVDMVGLEPAAAWKYPSELSGGMRKKAGLARALALDPELLVLDEPTAGLDPIAAANFRQLLLQLRRTLSLTVFLVTHDLDLLHEVCDRVAILAEQRFLEVGPVDEVSRADHPFIQRFFRSEPEPGKGGRAEKE
ncbi:ABC transporter ATP-binding protein [Caenispirillum salinarum]|uniref:ABC transporter ATP-binding protein n=1 Tax=Caenispirillum salinarum TaxID=859058 RepID=UPI00385053C3